MAFQSYLACSWAAYDTIGKISGQLCLTENQLNELKNNPTTIPMKLSYLLLKPKKDGIGFWLGAQLKQTYGWPLGFSYSLRNWIMHEGHFQNGNSLFEREDRRDTKHILTKGALDKLKEKWISYEVDTSNTLSDLLSEPTLGTDLLDYITRCHQEVDECAGILVFWACSTVKLQADLLLARHLTWAR
jgi:hypothetical protein